MKKGKILFSILYLILPTLLTSQVWFEHLWSRDYIPVIIFHIVSTIGIIIFAEFEPCSYKMVVIGMAVSFVSFIVYVIVNAINSWGALTIFIILMFVTNYIIYCIIPYILITVIVFYIHDILKKKATIYNKIFAVIYMLYPAVLFFASPWLGELFPRLSLSNYIFLVYAPSLIAVIFFAVSKPCSIAFPLIGAAISPSFIMLRGYFTGQETHVLENYFSVITFFYTIPYIMATLLIYAFIKSLKKDEPC